MSSNIKNVKGFSAKELLDYVHNGYNSFAIDWSRTRQSYWSEFEILRSKIKKGTNILDLGCGNGRLFQYLKDITDVQYNGIDNSEKLIDIARQNFPDGDFEVGDALRLPFKNCSFDTVISIATAHHITPKSNRIKFFEEIYRVLKPGGTVFITVWNIYQDRYRKYLKMHIWQKLIQTLKSPSNISFGFRDCLIPFGEKKTLRYIHAFTPNEITKLVNTNFEVLEKIFTDKEKTVKDWRKARNICFYMKKLN